MALNRSAQFISDEFLNFIKLKNNNGQLNLNDPDQVSDAISDYFVDYVTADELTAVNLENIDTAEIKKRIVNLEILYETCIILLSKKLDKYLTEVLNRFHQFVKNAKEKYSEQKKRLASAHPRCTIIEEPVIKNHVIKPKKVIAGEIVEIPEASDPVVQRKAGSDCNRVSAGLLILAGATIFAAAVTLTLISAGIIPAIAGITIAATKLGLIGGLFGLGVGGTLFGMGVKKARDVEIELATLPRPVIKAA